ncbi:hypothetical protein NMY22_g16857 [Coprinellus aureogranulatus]|nr:hypothetical protein NMY22_g16857 [Coprinellus aureogranulatus]
MHTLPPPGTSLATEDIFPRCNGGYAAREFHRAWRWLLWIHAALLAALILGLSANLELKRSRIEMVLTGLLWPYKLGSTVTHKAIDCLLSLADSIPHLSPSLPRSEDLCWPYLGFEENYLPRLTRHAPMSPRKSHSSFDHDRHHRSRSPPPSSPTYSRRRRSPVRYSGNRVAMQAATQSYPNDAPQQRNGRRSIVLPPGKNDLEILENLKQIIKNGQHEFYRAIPQPEALASLYLGTIPTGEPATKMPEDAQGAAMVQDEPPKELDSPVEPETRPPRLKNKESWESGSFRRSSASRAEEQAAVTNGYTNEASEGIPTPSTIAQQSVSEFTPPSLSGTGVIPANGSTVTPPSDSRPPTRERPDIIPASDDSSTAVATSPVKPVSSPMSQIDAQDRDRNYSARSGTTGYTQPASYSRDDKRDHSGDRYRRDSYDRHNDRYPPRNAENNWRPHPQQQQQRPYRSNYDASSRPYVKTEEVPVSLSDLDSRAPLPPAGSGSAPSQVAPRNGNGVQSSERSYIDITDSAPNDAHGLPPGLSSTSTPNGQYASGRPAYDTATPPIKSEQAPPRRDSRSEGPISSAPGDQNGRPVPSQSDSTRMPPPYKDNRYGPRPPDRYRRD